MATARKKKAKAKGRDGTLIRGADGSLYFVSNAKLRASRVPAKKAAKVREELKRWESEGAKGGLTAVCAHAAPPSSVNIGLSAAGTRKSPPGY